jgi:hypothetical protein
MMDKSISIDGRLTTLNQAALSPNELLGANWVYTTINTLHHRPLHLKSKLKYALDSFEALYGIRPTLTSEQVAEEIYSLLHFGLYPEGGNTVTLSLAPTSDGGLRRYIQHRATTPYEGYGLIALRPQATIASYELPLERHQTSLSFSAAQFATGYAQRTAGAAALRASRAGLILSADDSPLLVVKGFKLLTAPIAEGGRHSVERELMFRLAQLSKVEIVEEAPTLEDIESYNEILVMTPVGILSIDSIGEQKLENIYAHIFSKHLTTLTSEGFAQ